MNFRAFLLKAPKGKTQINRSSSRTQSQKKIFLMILMTMMNGHEQKLAVLPSRVQENKKQIFSYESLLFWDSDISYSKEFTYSTTDFWK